MRKWKVFVSLLLVLIFISSSVFAAAYSSRVKVTEVKKEIVNGKEAIVIYKTDSVEVSSFKLTEPERLVFDLKSSVLANGGGYYKYNISTGAVKCVRMSQYKSDVVRVVLDIKDGAKEPEVEVINNKDKLIIIPKNTIENKVKGVQKEIVNGKEAIVVYKTNKVEVSSFKLTDPTRLIFDLKSSELASGGGNYQYDISIGPVKGVRMSQYKDDVVRVVLDIKDGIKDPEVEVINNKDKLIFIPQNTVMNEVKNIKKETVNGKDAIVVYKTNKVEINQFKLGSQDVKLVFDLKNSSIVGGGYYVYDISFGPIENVRASQFDKDVVRVVLDIKKGVSNPEVEVIDNKDKLIIIPKGVEPETPKKPSIIISIDAGHGGHDPGAVQNGVNEKDITLEVAKKLDSALKKEGYDIVMTRDKDVYVELKERADIANRNNSDIFISLHCNSFSSESAHGIEVLYNPNRSGSKQLAQLVLDELVKATGARNRGIKERPELAVLKHTTMPAILVEMGFISNKAEAQKLQTASYQNKIVEAIVKGVEKYIDTYN